MLIRGMVEHHLDNDPNAALVGGFEKRLEVIQSAVVGVNGSIIRDVITVVTQGRGKKGHQPNRIDAKFLEIVQFLGEAAKIPDSIPRAVVESTDVDLVDDSVFVPERILRKYQNYLPKRFATETLL